MSKRTDDIIIIESTGQEHKVFLTEKVLADAVCVEVSDTGVLYVETNKAASEKQLPFTGVPSWRWSDISQLPTTKDVVAIYPAMTLMEKQWLDNAKDVE